MGNVTTREFRNAVEKVGEYLRKFSESKPSFADTSTPESFWSSATVTHASISTQVVVCQPKGQASPDVIFSSAVVQLPKENLVAFFRQLLVWNNLATDVAHFGVNEEKGMVFLVLRRPFEGLDYSEFKDALETISTVNMNSIVMLRKSFAV